MSMRTKLPSEAADWTIWRALPRASAGAISRPTAVSLTETLASSPVRAIASSASRYCSTVCAACSRSRTNSPSTSTVADAPRRFSLPTVAIASSSRSPAM